MPTHPLNSTLLPSGVTTGASGNDALLRVATYNIHKGVRGVGCLLYTSPSPRDD